MDIHIRENMAMVTAVATDMAMVTATVIALMRTMTEVKRRKKATF